LIFHQPTWLCVLSVGFMLFTGQGWADTWQNAVTSRISSEYETNPVMSPSDPGSVRRVLFEPSYSLFGQVGVNELKAGLAVLISRSTNHTLSPNREDPSVFFDWTHQSEGSQLGISPKYAEMATIDSGVDATRPVPVSSTRASRSLTGRWNKELSERSSILMDGTYEGVTYTGGGSYVDYSSRSGSLRFNNAISELSTAFLRVSGEKYVPIGGGPSSQYGVVTLGIDWKLEDMDWSMQLGRYDGGGNTGLQGGATVHYTGQFSQLGLNAERQISSSGLGGFVKVDRFSGNWSYALSELTNIGIDLQWWKNLSTVYNDTHSISGIWLERSFSLSWKGRMNYMHNILLGGGNVFAYSNTIGVSLIYTNSDF